MIESFGEYASPTDTIAAILGTYPFSIGLFRELLQNSDDAKASKQTFVLDSRCHLTSSLFHVNLAETQGPSLFAFNDALFSQEDWEALQSIHRSSKKTDTSKIGKYGIGFRSCYHVTDTPQILSGSSLAILDPQRTFSDSGGVKFNIGDYPDHKATFDFFPDNGSVIRLPLRREVSILSKQIVTPNEIRTLFADFIREELDIVLLFLKHIKRIEIWEIDSAGRRKCIAGASIVKDATTSSATSYVAEVNIDSDVMRERRWRVLQSTFKQEDSVVLMSRRLGRDVRSLLDKHKLFPNLAIAIPLGGQLEKAGRLFTYLPLPIRTGFPCHVHGLFALTQSRQNLSNKSEVGVVRGSDDSVLIEWNQLLFDEYLPRTWVALLQVLIEKDGFGGKEVYDVWPPRQAHVDTGDSLYWKHLPANLLLAVVSSNAAVWPVVSRGGSTFRTLEAVHVASSPADAKAVTAMAATGMLIVQPPTYVLEMLDQTNVPYMALAPKSAHAALLHHTHALEALSSTDRLMILEYLLSSNELDHILDLPIVPLVNRKFIALHSRSGSSEDDHVLFESGTFDIFNQFDGNAISLNDLSASTSEILVKEAPSALNVTLLTPHHVVSYLKLSHFGIDFSTTREMTSVNEAVILWLSKFWVWVGNWDTEKDALLAMIQSFFLLPSRTTRLVSLDESIFVDDGVDVDLVQVLQDMDIAFVHQLFSHAARDVVKSVDRAIRAPSKDIHSVLDQIHIPPAIKLDTKRSDLLLNFVVQSVLDCCRVKPLDEKQQKALRSLPIFPTLMASPNLVKPDKSSRLFPSFQSKTSKTNTIKSTGPIPASNIVYGVTLATAFLLPIAHNLTFLDGANVDLAILTHLQAQSNVPLSEVDVVALALEYFAEQSKFLQMAFMEYMVQHRDSLPPRLLKILNQVKFIPVHDGTLQSPEHVIDPASPLTSLYSDSGDRVPRVLAKGENDVAFVLKQLRALGVLRGTLTTYIVYERIQHISNIRNLNPQGSQALSIQLIDLIYTSGFDATQLEIPVDAKWVPTNRGMLGHEECLDRGLHRPELFDEVFPLVHDSVNVSPSLRISLGWDKPLSMATLMQQLKFVIAKKKTEVVYRKTRALIKELSQRELSDDDLLTLKSITFEAPWIPISHHHIAPTSHAVFYLPFPLSGFFEIPLVMSERQEVRVFLEKMGCVERPETDVLVAELQKLQKLPPSNEKLQAALTILKALPLTLSDEEREEMLVPDMFCNLRPAKEVFFNDIGDRAFLDAGDIVLAHPRLGEHIAKRLHISRLGLKFLHLKNSGVDMGEKLTTTIRNVLKQYTEQQTLTEFLANASDAGASNFKIMVDDCHGPTERLLTPAMAPFQTCPSLLIYNDGVFTQKDFDGICRTGVGGKEGKTHTIGQFGLGALSMFHFTELAMIVSGDKVLFLDPSKTHLPLDDWASLLLPLQQMQRLYPDHLATLDGLFGFKLASTESYNATLFRLPLRNKSHINESSILDTVRGSEYIRDLIVRPYWRSAQQSLLFSKIASISTYHRIGAGRTVSGWSLHVDRDNVVVDHEFTHHTLRITGYVSPDAKPAQDIWKVILSTCPISALPNDLVSLIEPHRLRSPIVAGFAARTSSLKWQSGHHLFSTLPLPMATTLPVHLTASFILTPDRRHIRFDDYANLESQYNRWLLATVAPPIYLYLLHTLYLEHGRNDIWWPGNTTQQDSVTRVLVDTFFSETLLQSELAMCVSRFCPTVQMKPCDAVVLGSEPEDVTYVLNLLRIPHYISLPTIVRERCTGVMRKICQTELKNDILLYGFRFISLYEKGDITIDHIQSILRYLQEDEDVDLLNLPLLPLANGTLVPIEEESYKTRYCIWKPSSPSNTRLWESKDLVHLDFDARGLVDKYNVFNLTGLEVNRLLHKVLPASFTLDSSDSSRHEWITCFWKEYGSFGLDSEFNTKDFPLIPTVRLGHYVSMAACLEDYKVLIIGLDEPQWLGECFDKIGASVVRRNDARMPAVVINTLQSMPAFRFDKLLTFVENVNMKQKFASLGDSVCLQFATWCRSQVAQTSTSLLAVAMRLPIWPATAESTLACELLPATEVSMLPYNFPHQAVGPFATQTCVAFDHGLQHLGLQPLSLNDFWDKMKLPKFLDPKDSQSYKRMITAFISESTFTRGKVLVPNGTGLLVESDTLYARGPLFVAAFGSRSRDHFVLEEYADLEPRLVTLGLKAHNTLDLETFLLCATSIHEDVSGADREQRARIVFQAYCEDLPVRLATSGDESWGQLDRFRFIPRSPIRQQALRIEEYSQYTKSLPSVVAPREIVLPEYEGIAWTQRAVFSTRPGDRVLIANPSLGKPTIHDVIEHLRVLALEVARDYAGNSHVLADLSAVYKWLDEHQDEVGDELIRMHEERLFLNVEDPTIDVWIWNSADEMFLNIVDTGDLRIKSVRKFLLPFTDLLYVAGVEAIMNPPAPETVFSSAEAQYARVKKKYNDMRLSGKLTDVVFVSDDDERFPAHRSFLATMSEYLNDLFCGDFTEAGPASADEPVEVVVDYPGACVNVVMDFVYTGVSPDFEDLSLSVLLDILDLSLYWGFTELNNVTQAKIIAGNFINPITYGDIFQRATVLDAQFLLDACEYYERENRDAIERLKGGERQTRKNPRNIPRKTKSNWHTTTDSALGISGVNPRARKMPNVRRMMNRFSSTWLRRSRLSTPAPSTST